MSKSLLFSRLQHIFRTPLRDYNVLIHLHQRHLPLLEQGVDVTMATRDPTHKAHTHRMGRTKCSHLPVVDFNPAQQYLRELEVCHCLPFPSLASSPSLIPRPHGQGMKFPLVFERCVHASSGLQELFNQWWGSGAFTETSIMFTC